MMWPVHRRTFIQPSCHWHTSVSLVRVDFVNVFPIPVDMTLSLQDATSQAEITQLLDTIADEQGMEIIKDAKTVVRDLREVTVACADACAIRMKIKLHEFWIQDTSCAGFVPSPGSQNFIMAAANMQVCLVS